MTPIEALQSYWGYDSFRPLQAEIIDSILSGRDTVGLLPTGGGKSLTFQVPAVTDPTGLTIVVTPLISLMKDQVDALRDRSIKAMSLHTGLSSREVRLCYDRAALDKLQLLYISPERLQSERFRDEARQWTVNRIVVDEAHCISQWGHDFRPAYLNIKQLRALFPDAPVLALTASATPEVLRDICEQLELKSPQIFRQSFSRPNISYVVRRCDDKAEKALSILAATSGTAIIYTRSRRRTRQIAEYLTAMGVSADYYHAGLAPEDKSRKQERWKSGEVRVMVATNAFGMGIDKPDVRVVIHHDLPSSIEEYYQEAGRAGRDGKHSYAVALVASSDKATLSRRLSDAFPPRPYIRQVYENMCVWLNVAVGAGFESQHEFHLEPFCQRFHLMPVPAHAALTILSRSGYIEYIEETQTRSRLMILVRKDELYNLKVSNVTDRVLQHILRSYTGLYADYVYINETAIAYALGITDTEVYDSLLELTRMHILHYIPRNCTPYIFFTERREETRHVEIPLSVYETRRDAMSRRIEGMKRFAFDDSVCRARSILEYFGEEPEQDCGTCDVCRARRREANIDSHESAAEEWLLKACSQPEYVLSDVIARSPAPRAITIEVYRQLLDNGRIEPSAQ